MSDTHNDTQSPAAIDPLGRAASTFGEISRLADAERERILLERPDLPDALLGPAEVMRVMSIGRTRYQQLVKKGGGLRSVKIGRTRLVFRSEVNRYMAEHTE